MRMRRERSAYGTVYAAGGAGLLLLLAVALWPVFESPLRRDMAEAARLMGKAEAALRDCRARGGIPADASADPNGTGVIGVETSPVTTSLGNPAAKRTTANPDFAALLVSLLDEAGVRRGDAVAVGASGSFPALIIATLSAAKVMGVEPLVICSLGASEWGANIPGFDWLDMQDCLRRAGLLEGGPVALAVGGEDDVGRDLVPAGRDFLRARIIGSGIRFVEKPGLREDVEERLAIYAAAAAGRPVKAFVNIGGSSANIGTNAGVLKLRPGLLRGPFVTPPDGRGVLQEMAAGGVPVIHLLNIKGLCERYGLPWDPRPLPEPGRAAIYRRSAGRERATTWLAAAYILLIAAALASRKRVFLGKDGP
jgi:poly-gamma-glutamate system protein